MYKSLNALEKSMVRFLTHLDSADFDAMSFDERVAVHECIAAGYLENISEFVNANGDYSFSKSKCVRVSKQGHQFVYDRSLRKLLKDIATSIHKGIWGYILGVITGASVEVISFALSGSGAMMQLLQWLQSILP